MYIKIKVFAEQKQDKLVEKSKDSFDVYVKEAREDGHANKKVLEILKKHFKVYNDIRIVNGHHSPSKIISLEK
jgi:uncharacterized protein (TIGR00251 family)